MKSFASNGNTGCLTIKRFGDGCVELGDDKPGHENDQIRLSPETWSAVHRAFETKEPPFAEFYDAGTTAGAALGLTIERLPDGGVELGDSTEGHPEDKIVLNQEEWSAVHRAWENGQPEFAESYDAEHVEGVAAL
ncbi:hypothetical protein [Streptomyces sp. CBMA123]|uniref:hypothetical protein n=1 Tax=Streptomyces sp. CBMA123 TaxID=1896313 RepID=UPI001661DCC6|nr:hypothetical protein [Streptomyces sp. CBMA123]